MLKPKVDNLESRLEVYQSIGYPNGTRNYYFYSHVNQKVSMSTNSIFLKDDYVMSNKPRSEVNWRALNYTPTIA